MLRPRYVVARINDLSAFSNVDEALTRLGPPRAGQTKKGASAEFVVGASIVENTPACLESATAVLRHHPGEGVPLSAAAAALSTSGHSWLANRLRAGARSRGALAHAGRPRGTPQRKPWRTTSDPSAVNDPWLAAGAQRAGSTTAQLHSTSRVEDDAKSAKRAGMHADREVEEQRCYEERLAAGMRRAFSLQSTRSSQHERILGAGASE